MLNWIVGYVRRWTGFVADPVIDLVHWGLHAVASVVYTVFGHVGAAWLDVWHALEYAHKAADEFIGWTWAHFWSLIRHDLPKLWHQTEAWYRTAVAWIQRTWLDTLARIGAALQVARRWIDDAIGWVLANVWAPLKAAIDQTYRDLVKWGYYAYQMLTHLDVLAGLILGPLISASESAFWAIARPLGEFAIRLVLANARRFAQMAEDIIMAVF